MNRHSVGAALFLLLIAATFAATFFTPVGEVLKVEGLQRVCASLNAAVQAHWALWAGLFFVVCIVGTALSFPAGPVIGIAAGALFGFWPGLLLVWGAQSVGSTLAFIGSRHFFRDVVEAKLGARFQRIEQGFEEQGAIYLLILRFNPLVPYWLVNLSMGLTHLKLATYVPLTIVGLLPALAIYANAGTQLATFQSLSEIMSPTLIVILVLLSLFPLLVKFVRKPAFTNKR